MKSKILKPFSLMAAVTLTLTLTHPANALTIGFVRGSAAEPPAGDAFDVEWVSRLRTAGHTVTMIDDNTASGSVPEVDLFIVSQDVGGAGFLGGVGINQPKPMLVYEPAIYDEIFGPNAAGYAVTSITFPDPTHPLAAGLTAPVTMYTGGGNMPTFTVPASPSAGTKIIAVNAASATTGTFILREPAVGNTLTHLRMGLPCYDDTALSKVTADAWTLLNNAISYAAPAPVAFDHLAVTASSPQAAGVPFDVTITAQDIANATVPDSTATVIVSATGSSASLMEFDWNSDGTFGDSSGTLVNGIKTIKARDYKAQTVAIKASAGTANTISPPDVAVEAGAFTKLQILAPGETSAPGTLTGKTGTLTIRTLDVAFDVTVNAVDLYWNPVGTTPSDVIAITSTDGAAILPTPVDLQLNGPLFSVTLKTVGAFTVTATDTTDGTKTASITPALTVLGTPIVWLGDAALNQWDTVTPNWVGPVAYADTNQVTFNATGAANSSVDIVGTVTPTKVTVNSPTDYTLGTTGTGSIAGAVGGFIKSGAGVLTLATANTYTGSTTVNGGVLSLKHVNALPAASALALSSNALLGLEAGDFTRTTGNGAGQVNIASGSGFVAYGADRVVNFGGLSAQVTWGVDNFIDTAGNTTFVLNHSSATHTVTFQNPVNLGTGVRFWSVGDGGADVDAILSGAITGGSIGFSKAGAGVLLLSNSGNAYLGQTYIDSGTLKLGASEVIPNGSAVTVKQGNNAPNVGVLDLNGFNETIGALNLGETGTNASNSSQTPSVISSSSPATLTLGGNLVYNAGAAGFENGQATITANIATGVTGIRNINVGNGSATEDLVISGDLTGGGINKQGLGTLVLANPKYSGNTGIEAGTLSLGAANPNNDASTVTVTSGAFLDLNYLGTDTVKALVIGANPPLADGVYGATQLPGVITGTGTLTVLTPGFSSWITGTFAGGATVPPGQQGPNDDPDNDGIDNLVEFAIAGQDPTVGNPVIGTLTSTSISYNKRPEATGVTYSIVESTDLGLTNAWVEVSGTGYVNNPTTITFTFTPGTPAKDFFRLNVTE